MSARAAVASPRGSCSALCERMREARRSQWPFPLASRATKQTARISTPDSVSRERGAGRGASWRRKRRKTGRSCCRSRTPSFAYRVAAAVPPGCGKMRRLRRARQSVEPRVRAPAKASAGPLRCTASQVQRYAGPPRFRRFGYDLRRAPRIHPHFASNAAHEGLNQRFPDNISPACAGNRLRAGDISAHAA